MSRIWMSFVIAVSFGIAGCSPSTSPSKAASTTNAQSTDDDKHDHAESHAADHPTSFAEAVKRIDDLRGEVKEGFAANNIDKADGPVHEIGHVLEDISNLAKKESLANADQEAVKKAVDELFDCFGKIDGKIHGGEGKTYDELHSEIDSAIHSLRKAAKLQE